MTVVTHRKTFCILKEQNISQIIQSRNILIFLEQQIYDVLRPIFQLLFQKDSDFYTSKFNTYISFVTLVTQILYQKASSLFSIRDILTCFTLRNHMRIPSSSLFSLQNNSRFLFSTEPTVIPDYNFVRWL